MSRVFRQADATIQIIIKNAKAIDITNNLLLIYSPQTKVTVTSLQVTGYIRASTLVIMKLFEINKSYEVSIIRHNDLLVTAPFII